MAQVAKRDSAAVALATFVDRERRQPMSAIYCPVARNWYKIASDMTGPRCRRRLSAPLLAICAFWAGLAAEAVAQGSAASDRAMLETLYDATGGPDWIDNTNWKGAAPLGEWFGVTTDTAGRVTRLELPGNGLAGPIPVVLGELALLRNLTLGSRWDSEAQRSVQNTLTGPIPSRLGDLVNLEWLDLTSNGLTGPVPSWLGRLTSLRWLSLGDNALTGPLPAELGDLVNLETLGLSSNALTGPVPSWLGRLTSLRWLSLGWNGLTGPLPAELGNLANLRSLDLPSNGLTGPVPSWLGRLTSLRSLDLSWNGLTGPLPAELGNLANLEWLGLSSNALTGPVPSWLGRLTSLRSLDLSWNGLTGPLPAELGNLANLDWLQLSGNALTGPVPSWLGRLTSLRSLDLSANPLTRPLPQRLTQLSELMGLDVSLTGACAPHDEAFQTWLATIDFDGELCNRRPEPVDAIPAQTLTQSGPALAVSLEPYFADPDDDALTYAAASGRRGTVTALVSDDTLWLAPGTPGTATVTVTARDPDGLSADQSVAVMTTASAGPQNDREALEVFYDATGGPNWTNHAGWKTSAPLDEWYGVTADANGRVTRLNLDGNGLTGPLPPVLERLANLEDLNLPYNDLVGPLPAWLGNLAGLRLLRLQWNRFTGPIPNSLGNLVKLQWLDVDWNDLTGPVPASLGNLRDLQVLILSENQLTGPIPNALGRLVNLSSLDLGWNALSGPVPRWLGDLTELRHLDLEGTVLTGPIPDEWGNLVNLEELRLIYAWGISGPLPVDLRQSRLENLSLFATQACTPSAWGDWPQTLDDFEGRSCDSAPDVTIDVAVVYTPAAREALGGAAATEAQIDLLIAETNQAFAESNANVRVALAGRSEVDYVETGSGSRDLDRLWDPSDGYMDEAHVLRDRVGADLVSLMVDDSDVCGIAYLAGAFSLTIEGCAFTHELGHNFGLLHDRYESGGGSMAHPAYGYVNQQGFATGALPSSRWVTIMAYATQCQDAYTYCSGVPRFSNPHQSHNGDPLGIAFGAGGSGATGPADAVAVLNATGPIVADWRDHVPRPNRPPRAAGTLPDRTMTRNAEVEVDVSSAFVDPDGDLLSYGVSSSAPRVVAAQAAGARVTLTAVSEGTATIRVTATDPGGLNATQAFSVTVAAMAVPFTDDPIVPGVTPIKAVHFTELRTRIDALRSAEGLARFSWTDPVLRPGVTRVRRVHLVELRQALAEAYSAAGRTTPRWTDASPAAGSTPIQAAHLTELRAAVLALE